MDREEFEVVSKRETNSVIFPTIMNVYEDLADSLGEMGRLGTRSLVERSDPDALKYLSPMFLDKFHSKMVFPYPVTKRKMQEFEKELSKHGIKLFKNYPKNYDGKGDVIFIAREKGSLFLIIAVIMFNGIVHCREIWEGEGTAPKTITGKNGFCDTSLYMDGYRAITEVGFYLEELVQKVYSIFSFFHNEKFNSPIEEIVSFNIKELEFNYNFLTMDVADELGEITNSIADKHGTVQLQKENEKITGGVKAEIGEGQFLKAYLKHEDVIRVEVQLGTKFFDKFKKEYKDRKLLETLFYLQMHSWKASKFLVTAMPQLKITNPYGFVEAIIELILVSGVKHFKVIARKLIEGNGHFRVKASEACYRSILKLKKEGILKPGFKRGRYELSHRFKVILENDNIVKRFLDK